MISSVALFSLNMFIQFKLLAVARRHIEFLQFTENSNDDKTDRANPRHLARLGWVDSAVDKLLSGYPMWRYQVFVFRLEAGLDWVGLGCILLNFQFHRRSYTLHDWARCCLPLLYSYILLLIPWENFCFDSLSLLGLLWYSTVGYLGVMIDTLL